jgi:signal transduction histidine kinase
MTPSSTQQSSHPLSVHGHFFQHTRILSIAVLLLVGGTLSWVTYDEYHQVQEAEYRLLEANARNADAQVSEALEKVEHLLHELAELRLEHGSDKTLSTELIRHQNDIPELGALLLSDAGGHIRSASDTKIVGRDISKEPYFSAHLNSGRTPGLFMSRPDSRLLGITAVTFTLPIVDVNRQFLGVAGVTVGFKFFPEVLQAINPDDSASMSVIFNREGDLLLRRENPEKFFGNNIAKVSKIFYEHFKAGKPVTRHLGPSAHNGKMRLFLVREVGDSGLGLILSRQLDEILAVWQRNIVIYALIFFFAATLMAALTIAAARRKQLEADIFDSHERLREIEQRQMLSQERQRLMQDMHDGLGSSLVSALRVVEHGRMSETEVAQVLKGCIDDLKLAIDSMEPIEADLLLLLATLRYRLGPRLESTGIALRWEVQNVPDLNWLDPKNSLHILRILQEAFTNIIKHTHATEIRLATGTEGDYVLVTITDNGQGFAVAEALKSGGKGLSNQLRRAEAIGGEVSWQSDKAGTCFTLRLPVLRSK